MSQETELKGLLREESALLEDLSSVRVEIRELQQDIVFKKFGLVTGKTILKHQTTGKTYRFGSIDLLRGTDKPWVRAALLRKDGSFGPPTKRIYDNWEVAKKPRTVGEEIFSEYL